MKQIFLALTLVFATQANASIVTYSGSFSGDSFSQPVTPDPFSGTWSFDFDDSQVTGSGSEFFGDIPLTSLNLNSNVVGSTVFDLSNSLGLLIYNESYGGLVLVSIYGAPNDSGMTGGTDDFTVTYDPSTGGIYDFSGVQVSNAGVSFIGGAANTSGTYTVSQAVPAPGTALLGLLGLGILNLRRKHPAMYKGHPYN